MMRLSDYTDHIEAEERIRPFVRAITAMGADPEHSQHTAVELARSRWGNDRATFQTIERAASTITSTTTSGLTNTAVSDLVSLMGPVNTSAQIFARAVHASLGGYTSVTVPSYVGSGTGFSFIAQGAPIPIRQLSLSAPTLTSKKVGAGWTMTREMMEGSNGEAFTRAAAAENLSLGVDTVLFDTNAADTLRPAGLRSYAVTLTPTAIGANITQNDAMSKDLAALAGNVAAVATSLDNIVFIASPEAAVKIGLRSERFPHDVFSSSGLPSGTVMALAMNILCVAAGPARFSVSDATSVHMEDTTPLAISSTPGTFVHPFARFGKPDTVAIKIVFDCDWAMRSSSGVSWVTGITW